MLKPWKYLSAEINVLLLKCKQKLQSKKTIKKISHDFNFAAKKWKIKKQNRIEEGKTEIDGKSFSIKRSLMMVSLISLKL